jgi:hypothetical protein
MSGAWFAVELETASMHARRDPPLVTLVDELKSRDRIVTGTHNRNRPDADAGLQEFVGALNTGIDRGKRSTHRSSCKRIQTARPVRKLSSSWCGRLWRMAER